MPRLPKIDLKAAGWCTPTILTAVIGIWAIIVMTVQLLSNKDKTKTRGLLASLLVKMLWTLAVVSGLYWLCDQGRTQAAWWIFGFMYILPVVAGLIGLMVWTHKEADHDEEE